MEGLKKPFQVFGMMIQFHRVRCPIHPNNFASYGQCTLETSQHIPSKGQLQLLLFANAVRPHKNRGFVAVFPERRGDLDSGQDTTSCGKPVYLEMCIDQPLAPLAEVLHCVGLDVGMCVLEVVEVALLM